MLDKPVYWLAEVDQSCNDFVGKKCANLGEMMRLGLPIPEGFCLSVIAHDLFLQVSGIYDDIAKCFGPAFEEVCRKSSSDIKELELVSSKIAEIFTCQEMPEELKQQIDYYYEKLCDDCKTCDVPVAVRSSGSVSMPGQMETYLNVRGKEDLSNHIKKVWASAYTPRAIYYRLTHPEMRVRDAQIGVAVLRMINARSAGVGFTAHPCTGNTNRVIIEANWGVGESVVQGLVTPDVYQVNKDGYVIDDFVAGDKTKCYELIECGIVLRDVPEEKRFHPCIEDREVTELTRLAMILEKHFNAYQDFEWVIDKDLKFPDNVYIVQTRPAKNVPEKKSDIDMICNMFVKMRKYT